MFECIMGDRMNHGHQVAELVMVMEWNSIIHCTRY